MFTLLSQQIMFSLYVTDFLFWWGPGASGCPLPGHARSPCSETTYINDAPYCRQCPDLAQCALTVAGSIGQAVLLLPYILSYMCALVLCMVLFHSVSDPLFQVYLPHLSGSRPMCRVIRDFQFSSNRGLQRAASPLPEREVSSHPPHLPAAAGGNREPWKALIRC